MMALVLPSLNDVIDLHSKHLALASRHLPLPIMVVLLGHDVFSPASGSALAAAMRDGVSRVLDSMYAYRARRFPVDDIRRGPPAPGPHPDQQPADDRRSLASMKKCAPASKFAG